MADPIVDDTTRLAVAARLQERYRTRNLIAFWLLGFLNNYYYCVVLAASESIAEEYGLKSLTALVSWAEIIGGCWVRLLNAFVFTHFGYNWRVVIFAAQAVVGVGLLCIAPICGDNDGFRFALSLLGIFSIGNASSYGESAMLGYLDRLPPMTLAGWSSGTGLSGVAASLVYLGLGAAPGMNNTWIFLINLPCVALYCFSFFRLVTPIRPAELDAAIRRATTTTSGNTAALYDGASTGAEDPVVERAVAHFAPGANWGDAGQWGRLTCKAPPGFAEREAARKPIVVVEAEDGTLTTAKATDDARPLLADDHHTPAATPAAAATDDDGSPREGINQEGEQQGRRPAAPESCIDRTLGCLMPGAPVWAVKFTHRAVFWNCLNLFLVYVFEYAIQFLAPYSWPNTKHRQDVHHVPCPTPTGATMTPSMTTTAAPAMCAEGGFEYDWATKHAFVLSQFCYQVGVLISRSSLRVVRIRRVWVLSLIQGVNFVLWLVQAKTLLLSSDTSRAAQAGWTAVLLVWMVGVGLMGGASYVNVFYNILNDDDPSVHGGRAEGDPDADGDDDGVERRPAFNFKELAMNIGALYATAGITVGCMVDVILSNSFL